MGWRSIGVIVGAGLVVFGGVVGLVGWLRWGGVVLGGRGLVCHCGGGLMVAGFSGLFVGVFVVLLDGGLWPWALGWCVCLVSIYSGGCVFVGESCSLVGGCVGGVWLDSLVAGGFGMTVFLFVGMVVVVVVWCSCLHGGLDVCVAAVICGGLRSLFAAFLFGF